MYAHWQSEFIRSYGLLRRQATPSITIVPLSAAVLPLKTNVFEFTRRWNWVGKLLKLRMRLRVPIPMCRGEVDTVGTTR